MYQKKYFELCPIIKKKIDFCVEYDSFTPVGETSTHFIKMGFSCYHMAECKIDSHNECPLYNKAPENIHC